MTRRIFTASNGYQIKPNKGWLDLDLDPNSTHYPDSDMPLYLDPLYVEALREYFRGDQDEEYRRWRDPENPQVVVYLLGGGPNDLVLFDEKRAKARIMNRDNMDDYIAPDPDLYRAARRYFEAHPEPEPKPWETAKPGEAWEVEFSEEIGDVAVPTIALALSGGFWQYVALDGNDWSTNADIITGRRIWPEEEGEDK